MKNIFTALCLGLFFCSKSTPSFSQAVNVSDSMALVDLYNNTNGANWTRHDNWLQGPVKNWYGVTLTPNRVLWLRLGSNNLNGEIPASLGNLASCETLGLNANRLRGTIPESLGNLISAGVISLEFNNLTGSIPDTLGYLPNLEILSLQNNQLSGKIPESLGSMAALRKLLLSHNKFTFEGMENLAQKHIATLTYSLQDTILPIKHNDGAIYVSAGGTLANNVYKWFQQGRGIDTTIIGDSTFTPRKVGVYHAEVSNTIATDLILKSSEEFPPVAVINPNPNYLFSGETISTNIPNFYYSDTISKAATDGITKLMLVAPSSSALTFTINGTNLGKLSSLYSQTTFSNPVTIAPDFITQRVVAIYTVPDGYGKENLVAKHVTITISNNAGVVQTVHIQLVKPPVILVHGMWSNPDVWKSGGFVKALNQAGFTDIFLADYSQYAATTFNPKSPESIHGRNAVSGAVAEALHWYRLRRIAVTQADVVGHSLGGLMTRSWSQQPGFKKADNFQKGYVHKLITLGTPHRGSPLGPELVASQYNLLHIRKDTLPIIPLWLPLTLIGMPVGSCHADFGVTSPGIKALQITPPYLTYSIVGDQTGQLPGYLAFTAFCSAALNHSYAEIFKATSPCTNTLTHDLIVPLSSQKGYINTSQTFISTGHSIPAFTTETNSTAIQDKVIKLLLSDSTSEFSVGFPTPSSFPLDCTTANQRVSSDSTNIGPAQKASESYSMDRAIKIASPLSGSAFISDSSTIIKLQYEKINGAQVGNCVFLVQNIGWFTITDSSDNSTTFTLPAKLGPGKLSIFLLAKDSSGITLGDSVNISILPAGLLDSIAVDPLTVSLDSSLREGHVQVRGFYKNSQGVVTESDISRASAGTIYQAKIGGVFSVTSDGLVTGKQGGTDTLIITNATKAVRVSVNVDSNIVAASFYPTAIAFPTMPDKVVGDQPFALTATSTSGQNVNYTLVSGPAVLSNGIVNLTGSVGTVVIKASSPRTAYFDSAISVTRSFHVLTSVVYTFNGNGNWSIPGNWVGGQLPPANLASGATIFINPLANGECVLDGNQTIPAGVNLLIETGKKLRIVGRLEMK